MAVTMTAMAQTRAQLIRERLLSGDRSGVLVASHRGDWRNFSENSIEGLKSAVAMGVDIVELDLQMTADSQLIVIHDSKLDRTTTGKGRIAEITLDSIRNVRLKNGCGIRTRQHVPTLEEYLLAAKDSVMLNLDKADCYFEQVMEIVRKTGTAGQIIMKGNQPLQQVKEFYGQYLDEIIYMPKFNLDDTDAEAGIEEFIDGLQPVAFEFKYASDTNPLPVKLARTLENRTLVWYNTLWDTHAGGHDDDMSLSDLDGGYGYLIDTLGCRIIQTDRPGRLLDYLRSRNLHN